MNSVNQIRTLIDYLNYHTKLYDEGHPEISDTEWDSRYFELDTLEKECGVYYNDSPTQRISYEVVNSLEKVAHNHDMLSLEKTKALSEIKDFLGNVPYLAMCKMDGLTCSLKYYDGILVSAETRGNGQVGENILHNARVIPSIPKHIPYKGTLVIDGEIICSKHDFEAFENEYKNPRNFAAGGIRLLDANECAKRKLQFIAWDVIQGLTECKYLSEKLLSTKSFGFTVVPYCHGPNYDAAGEEITIEDMMNHLIEMAEGLGYPIDGLVFKFDDVEYGHSLGQTAHHFKNAMAFKFADEVYESRLTGIEWTMGRTGVLTPVALFEPVDMDGSTVSRASLHNISIMEELLGLPYFRQKVEVFKANMIIPQIFSAEKLDRDEYEMRNGWLIQMPPERFHIPTVCPICGEKTEVRMDIDTKVLYCTNSACEGKLINRLDHFCGKKGLDIKGLSTATLEKLCEWGWVSSSADLFELKQYRGEWIKKAGFGPKSVDKILEAIDIGRECSLDTFIASLGIPLIGSSASKELVKVFSSWDAFIGAVESGYHFWSIPNFGMEMHMAITKFDYTEAKKLCENYLKVCAAQPTDGEADTNLDGMSFVITGKVSHFKNRDELKSVIESRGGKVAGSISGKTNYLINNDVNSTSSKNVSAQKLGIPIISEDTFIEMFGIQ